MGRYLLRRTFVLALSLIAAGLVLFVLLRLLPGDPAAALLSVPAAAQQSPSQPSPRISVTGEGEVNVAPDMAILNLTVLREAETARAALTARRASSPGGRAGGIRQLPSVI